MTIEFFMVVAELDGCRVMIFLQSIRVVFEISSALNFRSSEWNPNAA